MFFPCPPSPVTAFRSELRAHQVRDEKDLCRRRKDRVVRTLGPSFAPVVEACACRDLLLKDLDWMSQSIASLGADDIEQRIRVRGLLLRMLDYPTKYPSEQLALLFQDLTTLYKL